MLGTSTLDAWTEYQKRLEDASRQISAFFFSSGQKIENRNASDVYTELAADFLKKLMEHYSVEQRLQCLAFHALTLSTTTHMQSPQLDFQGEYSVLDFFERVINDYIHPASPQKSAHATGPVL
jgi:hypothetical protein